MIKQFLKEDRKKLNSLTKYPSILTFHRMVDKGNLIDSPYEDNINDFYATEKIDGTNTRIIIDRNDVVIGSRENLLYLQNEYFYDTSQGIVEYFLKNNEKIDELINTFRPNLLRDDIIVVYGELYGGKIGSGAKNYGSTNDFSVFDIVKINRNKYSQNSINFLDWPIEKISNWRERETDDGIIYGQEFLSRSDIEQFDFETIQLVPLLDIKFNDVNIDSVFKTLSEFKQTLSQIDETAKLNPEGVVIKNDKNKKRYKIRFEDYKKYFKERQSSGDW